MHVAGRAGNTAMVSLTQRPEPGRVEKKVSAVIAFPSLGTDDSASQRSSEAGL